MFNYSLCSYSMIISPTRSQWWHMGCKSHCPLQRELFVYLCLFFGSSDCALAIYFSLQCGFFHTSLFVMIVLSYSPNVFCCRIIHCQDIEISVINLSTLWYNHKTWTLLYNIYHEMQIFEPRHCSSSGKR